MNHELNRLFISGNDTIYYRNNWGWWIYHYKPEYTAPFGRGWLCLCISDEVLPSNPPPRQSSPLEFLLVTGDAFERPDRG